MGHSLIYKLQHLRFHGLRTSYEHTERDIIAKSGYLLKHLPAVFIQGGNFLGDDLFQGLGEIALLHGSDNPSLTDKGNLLVHDEFSQDFANKKGISLCNLEKVILKVVRLIQIGKYSLDMPGYLSSCEGGKGDLLKAQFLTVGRVESFQRTFVSCLSLLGL